VSVRARGLDPGPCGLDKARLVDFCNHNNPRARPHDRLSPVSWCKDRNPCTRHGQRRLAVRYGAEAPPYAIDVTGRGFTGQGRPAACAAGSALPRGRPRGRRKTGVTPTRSARTPLVVRPLHRRLETPGCEGPLPSGRDTRDDPTTRTPPPRRVGARGPWATRLRRVAGAKASLTRTPPGPRAASPALPRRRPGLAVPEVPSIVELATAFSAAEATPSSDPEGRSPPGRLRDQGCPQVVGNLWTTIDSCDGFSLDPPLLTERWAGDRAARCRDRGPKPAVTARRAPGVLDDFCDQDDPRPISTGETYHSELPDLPSLPVALQ